MKALAGVPDACMDVGTELVVTEAVDKNHKGKSSQQCTTTHTQSKQQQISQLTQIIDNLIKNLVDMSS